MYKLELTSKERWIFIFSDNSLEEPDEFVELVKEYQIEIGGEIIAVSEETQYTITNDPLQLVFQWDTLFGITVIVPHNTKISDAENAMYFLCEKLNEKQKKS